MGGNVLRQEDHEPGRLATGRGLGALGGSSGHGVWGNRQRARWAVGGLESVGWMVVVSHPAGRLDEGILR